MRGSFLQFLVLTIVFEIVVLGLGLFVSTISRTQQQAMFTTAFFVLPPFLFLSGFAFPIENMPWWIQPLTYAIPLRYYLDVIRAIFLTGAGIEQLWQSLVALLASGVVIFGASFLRFRKSLE
jgi:ABC-2 type transport system permease protein